MFAQYVLCVFSEENGGVAIFNGITWEAWTTQNSPLPHVQVEAVELDRLGNVWISTASQGITVFKEGGVLTGKNEISANISDSYRLDQNYPNPFNPTTKIKFSLPKSGFVKLEVFDIVGREVSTLLNEIKNAGEHTITFNGSLLFSGVYFYQFESNGFTEVKRMMLVK